MWASIRTPLISRDSIDSLIKQLKIKDYRGRPYYLARIIPMRGSWLDFEFDSNDYCYVRIDKKKQVLVTTFLQALGVARDEIISYFYSFDRLEVKNGLFLCKVDDNLIGQRVERGLFPEKEEKLFLGKRIFDSTL